MSLNAVVKAMLRAVGETVSQVLEDIIEEEEKTSNSGLPPVVSPAKKAEQYWPITSKRAGSAPAWPPFSGHRVPLGGDR